MLMTRGFLGPLEAFKTHRNLMAYSFLLFEILSVRLPVAAAFQLPSLKSYLPARTFVPAGPLVAGFFLQKIFFGEGEHYAKCIAHSLRFCVAGYVWRWFWSQSCMMSEAGCRVTSRIPRIFVAVRFCGLEQC
jgi:hypothetical protein